MLSYDDLTITYPIIFLSACTASWCIKELLLKMSLTYKPAAVRRKIRPEDYVRRRAAHVMVSYNNLLFLWGGYMEEPFEENSNYDISTERSSSNHPPEDIYIYNSYFDIWEKQKCTGDIPEPLSGACAAVHKHFMYLFGGLNPEDMIEGYKNNLWKLNLRTFEWTEVMSDGFQPYPCDKSSSWVYENRYYIFGGFGPEPVREIDSPNVGYTRDSNPYSSVQGGWLDQLAYYDIGMNKWIWPKMASGPCPRAAHAATVAGDCAYVFGGRHRARRLNDLFKLDLKTHTWENVRKVSAKAWPPGRSWHTIDAISNDKLVLYGGFSPSCEVYSDIWLFDTISKQWRRIFESIKRSKRKWHTSAEISSGQIIYVGGVSSNITDASKQTDHAENMLLLRFSPSSLTSMCLDKISCDRKVKQEEIDALPHYLKNVINIRREPKYIHGLFNC